MSSKEMDTVRTPIHVNLDTTPVVFNEKSVTYVAGDPILNDSITTDNASAMAMDKPRKS